eukprot:TRINITY_DN40612_c0_g1_i1.p1 TRINITY_DN40612_c0_g1~~TRINITY_DN40612_c0_g1_i1.p1  ORF type:complete len:129 (+),score=16.68 TRINITY_DN40612_c0_g1_i1:190-576(+)
MSHRANRAALFGSRAHGASAPATSGSIYDDATAKALESENNRSQEELHQKVLAFKGIATDIHDEVKRHHSLLDSMNQEMETTNSTLSDSLNKLGTLLQQGGSMHMCHLILFVCVLFFLLYWMFVRASS